MLTAICVLSALFLGSLGALFLLAGLSDKTRLWRYWVLIAIFLFALTAGQGVIAITLNAKITIEKES